PGFRSRARPTECGCGVPILFRSGRRCFGVRGSQLRARASLGVFVPSCYRVRTMSLAQVEYFVAVAEERCVTRPAARLHLSQPPLRRALRRLEGELGATLFERRPRGVELSTQGEKFLVHAREILASVERASRAFMGESQPRPFDGSSSPSAT